MEIVKRFHSGTYRAYVQLGAMQRSLLLTVCPTWLVVVRIRGQWSAQLFANDAPKYEPRRILIRHQKLQPLPRAIKKVETSLSVQGFLCRHLLISLYNSQPKFRTVSQFLRHGRVVDRTYFISSLHNRGAQTRTTHTDAPHLRMLRVNTSSRIMNRNHLI